MALSSVEKYNQLDGKTVSRSDLKSILDQAESEGQNHIVNKLVGLLMAYENEAFEISLSKKATQKSSKQGLAAARHSGMAKLALDNCGRLKSGYKYQNGKIVATKERKKKNAKNCSRAGKKLSTTRSSRSARKLATDCKVKTKTSSAATKRKTTVRKKKEDPEKKLKSKILSLKEKFGLSGSVNNFPEITIGLNGSILADGHEIFTDELLGFYDENEVGLAAAAKDVEKLVNEMIFDRINSDEQLPPWRKSWANYTKELAQNFITKKPYTGSNAMILNLLMAGQFKSPYYLTPTQITAKKGRIKKGEKAIPLVYYRFNYFLKDLSANPQKERELLNKIEGREVGKKTITKKNYPGTFLTEKNVEFFKIEKSEYLSKGQVYYFNVFNLEQTTGIEYTNPQNENRSKNDIIERAESIWKGFTDKPSLGYDKDQAFYTPSKDEIRLPKIAEFDNSEEYYSTLFHEMIHSTRIESRIDRDKFYKNKNQETVYAFEELIAELGSSYLCGIAGILESTSINTSSYLKNWHEKLQELLGENKDFFVFATKEAQKAADYILKGFVDPDEGNQKPKTQSTDKEKAKAKAKARAMVLKIKIKNKK